MRIPHKLAWRSIIVLLLAVGLAGAPILLAQTSTPANKSSKKKNRQIDPSSTAAPRGDRGSGIEGTVLTSDGKPASGVQIMLTASDDATQRWITKSDDSGHFRFTETISPGTYIVTTSAGELVSTPARVSWPGDRSGVRLELRSKSDSDKDTKSN